MRFDKLSYFEDEKIFELNCSALNEMHEGGMFVQTTREIFGDKYIFSRTTRQEAEKRYAEEFEAYQKFVDGGCKDEMYYWRYRAFHNEFKFMLTLMDALGKDCLTKEDYEYVLANTHEIYKKCLEIREQSSSEEEVIKI